MTQAEVRQSISEIDGSLGSAFSSAQAVSAFLAGSAETSAKLDLLIRLLDALQKFPELGAKLEAVTSNLCRSLGLFPYASRASLPWGDQLAFECHAPAGLSGIVFHRVQTEVYLRILRGENVALSAPTSFGKSLIIDAVIASGRFRNVVIVVPTIALIDETRRRLSAKFSSTFKIINHKNYGLTTDEAVDRAMKFLRSCEYNLPTLVGFIQDVSNELAESLKLEERANYTLLQAGLQNWFMPEGLKALEEFGIPSYITAKLSVSWADPEDVDSVVHDLRWIVDVLGYPAELSALEFNWVRESLT